MPDNRPLEVITKQKEKGYSTKNNTSQQQLMTLRKE